MCMKSINKLRRFHHAIHNTSKYTLTHTTRCMYFTFIHMGSRKRDLLYQKIERYLDRMITEPIQRYRLTINT
jgi:hypothetical protein